MTAMTSLFQVVTIMAGMALMRCRADDFGCVQCEMISGRWDNKCSESSRLSYKVCSAKSSRCVNLLGLHKCSLSVKRACATTYFCQTLQAMQTNDCRRGMLLDGQSCGTCCQGDLCNLGMADMKLIRTCSKWVRQPCSARCRVKKTRVCTQCDGQTFLDAHEEPCSGPCIQTSPPVPVESTSTAQTTEPAVHDCRDLFTWCARYAAAGSCTDPTLRESMEKNCRLSCKSCRSYVTTDAKLKTTSKAALAKTTISDLCTDDSFLCSRYAKWGFCSSPDMSKMMTVLCKKSCGYCTKRSTLSVLSKSTKMTEHMTTQKTKFCKDLHANCSDDKLRGDCSDPGVQTKCPYTCGKCTFCKDVSNNCTEILKAGLCYSPIYQLMKCPKTCGSCSPTDITKVASQATVTSPETPKLNTKKTCPGFVTIPGFGTRRPGVSPSQSTKRPRVSPSQSTKRPRVSPSQSTKQGFVTVPWKPTTSESPSTHPGYVTIPKRPTSESPSTHPGYVTIPKRPKTSLLTSTKPGYVTVPKRSKASSPLKYTDSSTPTLVGSSVKDVLMTSVPLPKTTSQELFPSLSSKSSDRVTVTSRQTSATPSLFPTTTAAVSHLTGGLTPVSPFINLKTSLITKNVTKMVSTISRVPTSTMFINKTSEHPTTSSTDYAPIVSSTDGSTSPKTKNPISETPDTTVAASTPTTTAAKTTSLATTTTVAKTKSPLTTTATKTTSLTTTTTTVAKTKSPHPPITTVGKIKSPHPPTTTVAKTKSPHPPPTTVAKTKSSHPPITTVAKTKSPHPPTTTVAKTKSPHPPTTTVAKTKSPHPPTTTVAKTKSSHPPPTTVAKTTSRATVTTTRKRSTTLLIRTRKPCRDTRSSCHLFKLAGLCSVRKISKECAKTCAICSDIFVKTTKKTTPLTPSLTTTAVVTSTEPSRSMSSMTTSEVFQSSVEGRSLPPITKPPINVVSSSNKELGISVTPAPLTLTAEQNTQTKTNLLEYTSFSASSVVFKAITDGYTDAAVKSSTMDPTTDQMSVAVSSSARIPVTQASSTPKDCPTGDC